MSVSDKTAVPADVCISVITVLHNSEEALVHSMPPLAKELSRIASFLSCEALFVDNASDNDPTEALCKQLPQARVIRLSDNVGFAAGCNLGAQSAVGEYLFFVNPDVVLDEGAIEELINTLNTQTDAWATTGRMRNTDGSFQPTCRRLPTKSNIFGSRGSALAKMFNRRDSNNTSNSVSSSDPTYTMPDFPDVTAVPAAAATALMIRKETFDKLGGFDERFFMYLEDTDLSAEIHERGGKIYFCPQAGAVHYWGAGSRASSFNRLRWHHLSVWRYYRKRLPGFFSSVILPVALLTNFLISACVSIFRNR